MFGNIDFIEGFYNVDFENGGEGFINYLGVVQVIEVFVYMLLVDYVNDVFYFEVNKLEEFLNLNIDFVKLVYDVQLELFDVVIVNFQVGGFIELIIDFYFGDFDVDNWIVLVNILKFCVYNNFCFIDFVRVMVGINLMVNGSIIDNILEDFIFGYFDVQDFVELRYFFFIMGYFVVGVGLYMSNNFFDLLNVGDD